MGEIHSPTAMPEPEPPARQPPRDTAPPSRSGATAAPASGPAAAEASGLQPARARAVHADALLEAAPEAILLVDAEGRIVLVNRRAEALFGYERGGLIGQPLEILLPVGLRDVHARHRADFFAHPRTRPMGRGLELTARRRDGSEFPVEISLGYVETAGGLQALAFVTDTTERRRTEDALRRSEAWAHALLEASGEGIVIADREGRIVSANLKAEALFGYARGELEGQPLERLLPDRLQEVHRAHRARYFERPQARPMGRGLDLLARRKDGSEFPVEIALNHIEGESGIQAVAFVTDITHRLAVERAARQADRLAALGTLAAGIAHEINNPIGIMTSRVELMLLEAEAQGLPPAVVEDLRVLHRNAERVARIAQNLLSFARISPEDRGLVDLNRVVADTLELAQRQMGRAGVEIVTSLPADLPPIRGQASALEQVLLNLLTNARDALAGPGQVRIETELAAGPPRQVVLRVSDSGPGIPHEILPRIFDPFYTTKPAGTGLGLSVAYGIVSDHEGTIEVSSVPGAGTTFVLRFPAAPAAG
jgi:hypothetical protein